MITSVHNPAVHSARNLLRKTGRRDRRQFLVEGGRAVTEALLADAPVESLFVDLARSPAVGKVAERAAAKSIPVHEVSPSVMKAMSQTATAPGVLAVCSFMDIPAQALLKRPLSLVAVLGEVRDPGNAGTIIRTCRAAGADAVFVTSRTVDIYNSKLVRASAGALFGLPLARQVEIGWLLDELGGCGLHRVAANPRGSVAYDRIDMLGPIAFLVGNEAWGLSPAISGRVDAQAVIPMAEFTESLNVAVASAVLLFEAARQRRTRAAS